MDNMDTGVSSRNTQEEKLYAVVDSTTTLLVFYWAHRQHQHRHRQLEWIYIMLLVFYLSTPKENFHVFFSMIKVSSQPAEKEVEFGGDRSQKFQNGRTKVKGVRHFFRCLSLLIIATMVAHANSKQGIDVKVISCQ